MKRILTIFGFFAVTTASWQQSFSDSRVQNQKGLGHQKVFHPSFDQHSLRISAPKLCDHTVKQYSGYLDIEDEQHMFFWFFEARNNPSEAPLLLWLNGGPGQSSLVGLFLELGPCIIRGRNSTEPNPFSWNKHANVLFVDQPLNVGYSYSTDKSRIKTSSDAALDLWTFLQIFFSKFPEYSHLPFHIAGESYGGHYVPHLASVIHKKNKDVLNTRSRLNHINLSSVILANGLTEPFTQIGSITDYACNGPYSIFDPDSRDCKELGAKVLICQRLVSMCYKLKTRLACLPATEYCSTQVLSGFNKLALNLYDVRKTCNMDDLTTCYPEILNVDIYLDSTAVKQELGVNPNYHYSSFSPTVNSDFGLQGDPVRNSALLLSTLLDDGVRLLVYAGNADLLSNFIGNFRWMSNLSSRFQAEFLEAPDLVWTTAENKLIAGVIRAAGATSTTAGNFTFVQVFAAGHMVPYDQPEAALDLINRWMANSPLST